MKTSLFVKTLTLTFFVVSVAGFVVYKSGALDQDTRDFGEYLPAENMLPADTLKRPMVVFTGKGSTHLIRLADERILNDPLVRSGLLDSLSMIQLLVQYESDSANTLVNRIVMWSSKSAPVLAPEDKIMIRRYELLRDSIARFRLMLKERGDGSVVKK
jgi:hypothetical protein